MTVNSFISNQQTYTEDDVTI